jgi:hypothetical protein
MINSIILNMTIPATTTCNSNILSQRSVEADDDEDGGSQHRPTWMEDDP